MTAATGVNSVRHHRPSLAAGEALMAAGAAGGAVGLITGSMDTGETITSRLPFASPSLGGTALLVVVAVPMAVAAADAWRGTRRADATALGAGGLLMGWIVVEVACIRTFSWLQPACFAAGAAIAFAGWRGSRR
jgi:hypothetical protein